MAVTSLSPQFHLTKRSSNRKTGPIPVSTSSAITCPDSCPLKRGCYAKTGFHLEMHWQKVTAGERGLPFDQFLESIRNLPEGQLWRHNEAGDLPGIGDSIAEADQLAALDIGPVVVVVSEDRKRSFSTPDGHKVAICPNVRNPELTCQKCGLCQKADRRNIIAFPVHGNGKKHWEEV